MNRIQLRFGQAVGLKELIATLVVSGILLIVGTVVFAKVKLGLGTDSSPDTCYQQTNNSACFDSYVESTHENLTVSGNAGTAVAAVETTTYDAFESSHCGGTRQVLIREAKVGDCSTNREPNISNNSEYWYGADI